LSTWQIMLGDNMTNNLTRRVTKTTIPSINRDFDGTKYEFFGIWIQMIEEDRDHPYIVCAVAPSSFSILNIKK
jgi:hypothetical protein